MTRYLGETHFGFDNGRGRTISRTFHLRTTNEFSISVDAPFKRRFFLGCCSSATGPIVESLFFRVDFPDDN
eukprot:CAMPEP_0170955966 /NCGR_PEP_ID=MMETSP0735-20130129/33602_1 /TAXON_ID=186038 /ORGANISM="Fragilariopsis kerguelensis, Strain L26-C5" /LENGTH=70 /DNA_ID=CAMNT_0011368155 /DNA_START=388 /DNA_END=597 /DNA_ORIENTATION=+